MKIGECPHRPVCPFPATRFACGQRTLTEDAVNRGLVTREQGMKLLQKYRVPMTPPSKVYKGDRAPGPVQQRFEP